MEEGRKTGGRVRTELMSILEEGEVCVMPKRVRSADILQLLLVDLKRLLLDARLE